MSFFRVSFIPARDKKVRSYCVPESSLRGDSVAQTAKITRTHRVVFVKWYRQRKAVGPEYIRDLPSIFSSSFDVVAHRLKVVMQKQIAYQIYIFIYKEVRKNGSCPGSAGDWNN